MASAMLRLWSIPIYRSPGFFSPSCEAIPDPAKPPIDPARAAREDCCCWGGRIVASALNETGSKQATAALTTPIPMVAMQINRLRRSSTASNSINEISERSIISPGLSMGKGGVSFGISADRIFKNKSAAISRDVSFCRQPKPSFCGGRERLPSTLFERSGVQRHYIRDVMQQFFAKRSQPERAATAHWRDPVSLSSHRVRAE